MEHFQRVAALGSVDGNTMAFYADRDRDLQHLVVLSQMENDTYCKNCGHEEIELHNGICVDCICEMDGVK